ncbi:MAG: hypothetical protein ACXWNG_01715 [Candidatus Limnocylindrales bacterium]
MTKKMRQNEPPDKDTEGHVLRSRVVRSREAGDDTDTEGHSLLRGPISSRGE